MTFFVAAVGALNARNLLTVDAIAGYSGDNWRLIARVTLKSEKRNWKNTEKEGALAGLVMALNFGGNGWEWGNWMELIQPKWGATS